jgi:hypothetical protein
MAMLGRGRRRWTVTVVMALVYGFDLCIGDVVALYNMSSKSGGCVTIFLVCNLHMWQSIGCCKMCVLQIVWIQGEITIFLNRKSV